MTFSTNPSIVAACFALVLWWLGTITVLIISRRGHVNDRAAQFFAVVAYLFGLVGIAYLQMSATLFAVYSSFTLGVLVWGALEVAYFRGWLTGSSNKPCPVGATPSQRFLAGLQTSWHHELAVLLTGITLILVGTAGYHQTGTIAFGILWLMRWSAKLNLFFGVRNFSHNMLPSSMQYLGSYVKIARCNAFFPLSIVAGSVAMLVLAAPSIRGTGVALDQAAGMLLSALLLLAIIEHILLIAPFSDWPMWQWSLRKLALSDYAAELGQGSANRQQSTKQDDAGHVDKKYSSRRTTQ